MTQNSQQPPAPPPVEDIFRYRASRDLILDGFRAKRDIFRENGKAWIAASQDPKYLEDLCKKQDRRSARNAQQGGMPAPAIPTTISPERIAEAAATFRARGEHMLEAAEAAEKQIALFDDCTCHGRDSDKNPYWLLTGAMLQGLTMHLTEKLHRPDGWDEYVAQQRQTSS